MTVSMLRTWQLLELAVSRIDSIQRGVLGIQHDLARTNDLGTGGSLWVSAVGM